MNLVFDTSILIDLERRNKLIIDKIRRYVDIYPSPAHITFMTYFEFYHGLKNKNIKNKERAISFLNKFNVLKTTKKTAEILSDIKYECDMGGNALPLADLLIASQVIEHGFILVTLDTDFEKIRKLNKIVL